MARRPRLRVRQQHGWRWSRASGGGGGGGGRVQVRRGARRPTLAHHPDERDAALERRADSLADGGLRLEALRREHDQTVRHRRQPRQRARGEIEQQQRAFHAEPAVQLLPALVPEEVPRVRRVRTRRDEEHVVHLVRGLRERDAVLERVHDAFSRGEPHHLVQRGVLDPEVDERHAAAVPRRRARHVPRRRRGPLEVAGGGHEGYQRLPVEERRDEVVETRAREWSCAHGAGW